jgi:N-ethylmaleimide reductase
LQIWHGGRQVHPSHINGGQAISSSSVAINGHVFTIDGKSVSHVTPKEATKNDIKRLIEDFRKGAERAKKAGFDGIQLHGAHGYLVEQFLKDSCNKRTDEYGGSIENRSRFCLELLD